MIQQTSGGVTCEKTLDTMTLILEKTQMLDVVQSMKVVSTLTFAIRFGSLSKQERLGNQSKHHPNITARNICLGGAALLPATCSWNDLGRQTLSVLNNSILIPTIPTIQRRIHTKFSLSSAHWWSLLQGIEFLCLKFGLQAHFWRMKPSKMEASSPWNGKICKNELLHLENELQPKKCTRPPKHKEFCRELELSGQALWTWKERQQDGLEDLTDWRNLPVSSYIYPSLHSLITIWLRILRYLGDY